MKLRSPCWILLLSVVSRKVLADIDDFCGYAPLCGEADREFDWLPGGIPDSDTDGDLIFGAELNIEDCCKLKDTQPTEECQIVNPTGESYRTLTATSELCGFRGEDCDQSEETCAEYQLVIKPQWARESSNEGCCDSCTCFGDPQCISFDGDEKIWVLCDGRDVPRASSIWEMCRITEEQCSKEKDHEGNQCQYLAQDKRGRDWSVGMQGSPCVPNPDSDPSIITMYEVPDAGFKLSLEQGERGIIKKVFLDLECGTFTLDAAECMSEGDGAWTHTTDSLPPFFSYSDVVHGYDEHWTLVDPDSGISVSIRCHANHYEGSDDSYVPRINVEDLSDPLPRGNGGSGFCVSGEFDYGQATTKNMLDIFENDRCDEGLQGSSLRNIYRAICKNPGLPGSAHDSCVYHFCNKHYLPLYESIEECEQQFEDNLAKGFCKGVTYSERDTEKCEEQWFDSGAVETIQQYYNDLEGCTTTYGQTLDKCQSGIIIQYFRSNQWNDEIAIPSDYCSDEEIVLTLCDHKYLFNRQIRILQKTASLACGPVNQCTKVEGFVGSIELTKRTPNPTPFPTRQPTQFPTNFPTPYPVAPSPYPTPYPVSGPIDTAPPGACPETPLCNTDNENVEYDDEDSLLFEMDECCVTSESVCDSEQTRTQTTEQWYCGESDGSGFTVADSITGLDCEDRNEMTISVTFTHEQECCSKCTCYGDPRCYSFDGAFEEFILCDGRTPGLTSIERCIIRRDTCLDQEDHEGNRCAWANPLKAPPSFSNAEKQAYEENQYQVSRYGSPCRYDSSASDIPQVLMYETEDPYRLVVDHGERGYIQTVHLTTDSGEFRMSAERCLDGASWEVVSGSTSDMKFNRQTYGKEFLWTVEDGTTKIVLKIRCTGHIYRGSYTTTFINVDALLDWDNDRIEDSDGFCATSNMPEKNLATTEYTDSLRDDGFCDNWNEDTVEIMRREVARIITDNPGVTNIGVESAYRQFCQLFYSPTWNSIGSCVSAFYKSSDVGKSMQHFCNAVTRDTAACIENLAVVATTDGYKEAFREGYETYVVNFAQECAVTFGDLPEALTFDADTCQPGAELQFFNPRLNDWVTYAAFPDTGGPCSGYRVKARYQYHPKLFKNPLRIIQKHNTEFCNQCTQASAISARISFSPEPVGSF